MEVWKRDNYTYPSCDKKGDVEAHHRVSYRLTQNNSLNNLVSLCKSCHQITEWELTRNIKEVLA